MGVFFQPWWGSTFFGKTSSSVLQRCSPSFLSLPSWPSPRLLFSLQESALPPGHSQEGEARAEEEGEARRGDQAEEDIQEEGRPVHLLRGQRRGDREQQGGDEGVRHYGAGSQGVC